MDEEKQKEIANAFLNSLKALKKYDMYLLLRTNWIVGGIVLEKDKKETPYGDRTVFKVLKPDGRIAYEYGDRMLGRTIESCTFTFKDYPIILTERKVSSMMDEPKLFYPIITGIEAQSWSEMVGELHIRHQIIHHQGFIIQHLSNEVEVSESKLNALGSELRQLKDENKLLRQENTELKRAIAQIKKIAEIAIRENMTRDAMIQKLLKVLDEVGTRVVQTPDEAVEDLINQYTKMKGKMEFIMTGNGELEKLRSELAELKKLKEEVEAIKKNFSDLTNMIRSIMKEHGGSS